MDKFLHFWNILIKREITFIMKIFFTKKSLFWRISWGLNFIKITGQNWMVFNVSTLCFLFFINFLIIFLSFASNNFFSKILDFLIRERFLEKHWERSDLCRPQVLKYSISPNFWIGILVFFSYNFWLSIFETLRLLKCMNYFAICCN